MLRGLDGLLAQHAAGRLGPLLPLDDHFPPMPEHVRMEPDLGLGTGPRHGAGVSLIGVAVSRPSLRVLLSLPSQLARRPWRLALGSPSGVSLLDGRTGLEEVGGWFLGAEPGQQGSDTLWPKG